MQLCDIEGRFGQKSEIPVRLCVRSALGPRTVEDKQAQRSMAGGNGFSPGGIATAVGFSLDMLAVPTCARRLARRSGQQNWGGAQGCGAEGVRHFARVNCPACPTTAWSDGRPTGVTCWCACTSIQNWLPAWLLSRGCGISRARIANAFGANCGTGS